MTTGMNRRIHTEVFGIEACDWDNCAKCNYTTSPIACTEVKKFLLATGIEFHIEFSKTGVHVGPEETHDEFYGDEFSVNAQTEEEAVCLFALKCAERGLLRGA